MAFFRTDCLTTEISVRLNNLKEKTSQNNIFRPLTALVKGLSLIAGDYSFQETF